MPALGGGDRRRHRASQRRRGRRPRGDRPDEAAGFRRGRRRQAHPGGGERVDRPSSATSTRCSRDWSSSPRRPSSAPCTRSTKCARWPSWPTSHGLLLHVDGARLANAAAALGGSRLGRADHSTPGSTSSRSGGRRTACCSARRSWCSPPGWPTGPRTYASRTLQLASKMRFLAGPSSTRS